MADREDWIKGKKKNFESPLAKIVDQVITPYLDKTDKISATLLLNWTKIFPAELSDKISYQSFKRTEKSKNTLYITTPPQYALEISHKKEQITSYITAYFGYPAVQDIIVKKAII